MSLIELNSIELDIAKVIDVGNNIVCLRLKNDIEITALDAKKIDEAYVYLAHNKPFRLLVDTRDVRSDLTPEASEFFAKDPLVRDLRKGQAIVINSLHNKLLADFYMKFHKPFDPVKIFNNDIEKAYKWLLSLPLDKIY